MRSYFYTPVSAPPPSEFEPNPIFAAMGNNEVMDLGPLTIDSMQGEAATWGRLCADYSGMVYDPKRHKIMLFGGGHTSSNNDGMHIMPMDGPLVFDSPYTPTPSTAMNPSNADFVKSAWLSGTDGPYPRPMSRHSVDANVLVDDEFIILAYVEGNYSSGFSSNTAWDFTRYIACTIGGPASPSLINAPSQPGWPAGQAILLDTDGELPAPFVVGDTYYLVSPVGTGFNLALTPGGTPINTTTAGFGSHTCCPTGRYMSYELPNAITEVGGGSPAHYNIPDNSFSFGQQGQNISSYASCEHDPDSGKIIMLGQVGLFSYDLTTRMRTMHLNFGGGGVANIRNEAGVQVSNTLGYNVAMEYCPKDNYHYFFASAGHVYRLELDRANMANSIVRRLTTTGTFTGGGENWKLVWDSHSEKFIGKVASTGVYSSFDPVTKVIAQHSIVGDTTQSQSFMCIAYVPVDNVAMYIAGPGTSRRLYALRHSV